MSDFLALLVLMLFYYPLTLVINRAWVAVLHSRRDGPAQGGVAASAFVSLALSVWVGALLLGSSLHLKLLWGLYLTVVIGCMALVYISILCVSESGRRFYLMHLIEQSGGMSLAALRKAYGQEHMLGVRLDRLTTWKLIRETDSRYRLVRIAPYLYSRFFHLWGRLLGIRWF